MEAVSWLGWPNESGASPQHKTIARMAVPSLNNFVISDLDETCRRIVTLSIAPPAALGYSQHDFPELLAMLEPLMCFRAFFKGHHRVDYRF